jgi:hypothetical protein
VFSEQSFVEIFTADSYFTFAAWFLLACVGNPDRLPRCSSGYRRRCTLA